MSTSTNTSLFNALGFFLEKMRPYVIDVIQKAAPGKPWEGELFTKLSFDQQRTWNMAMRNLNESGGNTANLIDYGILFTFGVSFKDALKQEVGGYNEVNKLINYFKELKEVRNKCQHFQELSEDEILRAYLDMKDAAKLLEMQDVFDEILRIQNGDKVETTPAPAAKPTQNDTLMPSAPAAPTASSDDTLPSWFNFALPHYDIRNGQLDESIFAANLSEVALGTGPDVYTNPNLFFAKTYVTDGLRDISTRVVQALNGEESENRVISLQTGFGGGKTHSMLALYHMLRARVSVDKIPSVKPILDAAGLHTLPKANVAVLVGTSLDPAKARRPQNLPGITINTLWGEMAAQLCESSGDLSLYEYVKEADKKGISPGPSSVIG